VPTEGEPAGDGDELMEVTCEPDREGILDAVGVCEMPPDGLGRRVLVAVGATEAPAPVEARHSEGPAIGPNMDSGPHLFEPTATRGRP